MYLSPQLLIEMKCIISISIMPQSSGIYSQLIIGFRFTVNSDTRWCCTYLLDATDPLFIEIGKVFIEQQLKGIVIQQLLSPLDQSQSYLDAVIVKFCSSNCLLSVLLFSVGANRDVQNMEGVATYITGKLFFNSIIVRWKNHFTSIVSCIIGYQLAQIGRFSFIRQK